MDDKQTLRLICAIALAAGGEKNVKTIMAKAKTMAQELGEEIDGDGDDDDSETDDDSDSTDDDSDAEDSDEDSDSDGDEDSGNDEDEETEDEEDGEADEDSEDEDGSKKKNKPAKKPARNTAGSKAGKAEATKGKKFKAKPQAYARDNDTHKEIFSGLLKEVSPNWKKDTASKKRAKDTSVKLEGAEFLDAKGEVLASFKQSVKKHMGDKK